MTSDLLFYGTLIRSLELTSYLTVTYLLYIRLKLIPRSTLSHKLISTFTRMFAVWMVYILLDIIIPPIMLLGFSSEYLSNFDPSSFPLVFYGYDTEHFSIFIGNVLRDLQIIAAGVTVYYSIEAALRIKYGFVFVNRLLKRHPFLIVYFTALLFLAIMDVKQLKFIDYNTYIISARWDAFHPIGYLGFIIYTGMFTASCILFMAYYMRYYGVNRNEIGNEKNKMLYFFLGYIMLLLGFWFWIIYGLAEKAGVLILDVPLKMVIGHSFWILSPLFFYLALNIPDPEKSGK